VAPNVATHAPRVLQQDDVALGTLRHKQTQTATLSALRHALTRTRRRFSLAAYEFSRKVDFGALQHVANASPHPKPVLTLRFRFFLVLQFPGYTAGAQHTHALEHATSRTSCIAR
jgi:hypothetical protein